MTVQFLPSWIVGEKIGITNYRTIQQSNGWNIFTADWVWVEDDEISRRPGPETP